MSKERNVIAPGQSGMTQATRITALDDAWRAAEMALPEYWFIRSLILGNPYTKPTWEVVAAEGGGRRIITATGRTPAAALHALAAKVSE